MSETNDEISNFIPVSEKVYLLSDVENNISHDIPFSKSNSGEITIRIKAITDMFIRNHYVDGDDYYNNQENEKISTEFCHYNGIPYIPATSIKGMISNILELFTYSKLSTRIDESFIDNLNKNPYRKHLKDGIDMADALFGTTELKGRVFFSHFKASNNLAGNRIETILMSPEPKKNKIGWKHYPIKNNASPELKKKNENIITKFKPLMTGSTFKGKVRFHNLRDFEFGALLSALSFHNTSNCFHTVGMGKAQGYGKISLTLEYENLTDRLRDFEIKMNEELGEGKNWWYGSKYVKGVMERHSRKEVKSLLSPDDIRLLKEGVKVSPVKEDSLSRIIPEKISTSRKKLKSQIAGRGPKHIYIKSNLHTKWEIEERIINDTLINLKMTIRDDDNLDPSDVLLILDEVIKKQYGFIFAERIATECNCTMDELLTFSKDENIDIKNEESMVSIKILEDIKKYI